MERASWSFEKTGLHFVVFMGDHSKYGINTMFNTGTVVGVSANIFGAGLCLYLHFWGGSGVIVLMSCLKYLR